MTSLCDVMLVLMLLQTVIEVVYWFLAFCSQNSLKSLTASRRSGRFDNMHGLCAHCTCLSTMPPWELSANDWTGTVAT